MAKFKNQQNPPLPKKERVDVQGNNRMRVFAKSGTATMCIAKGLTQPAAKAFVDSVSDNAKKLGGSIECSFLIIR